MLAMGVESRDENSSAKKFLSSDAKPGDAGWKGKEKFLSDNADSITKLREAAGRSNLGFVATASYADFTDKDRQLFGVKLAPEEIEADKHRTLEERWIISTLLPDMDHLRNSALMLAGDARRAAIAGDGKTAYDDVVALLGISRHCEEMPFLVCVMVAENVQAQAQRRDSRCACQPRSRLDRCSAARPGARARRVANRLAARHRGRTHQLLRQYAAIVHGQRSRRRSAGPASHARSEPVSDARCSERWRTSGPSILENTGVAMLTLPAANMLVASRKDMVDLFDRITTDAEAKIDEPYWKRAADTRWDEELQALASGPMGKFRYLFVNMLIPAYDKVQNRVTVSDGERDGVFLGLALEAFHRKHNKWPAALGGALAAILAAVAGRSNHGEATALQESSMIDPLCTASAATATTTEVDPLRTKWRRRCRLLLHKAPRRKTATGCSGRLCRAIARRLLV